MSGEHLDLASEFPQPSRADWTTAVEKVLRGRPFDKVLVTTTRDGLDVQPLYTAADAPEGTVVVAPAPGRIAHGWDVRQRHETADPAATNRAVLEDLERGVTSVELAAPPAGWDRATLATTLDGVMLDLAPVALAPHPAHSLANASALASALAAKRAKPQIVARPQRLGLRLRGQRVKQRFELRLLFAARPIRVGEIIHRAAERVERRDAPPVGATEEGRRPSKGARAKSEHLPLRDLALSILECAHAVTAFGAGRAIGCLAG